MPITIVPKKKPKKTLAKKKSRKVKGY